MRQSKQRFSVRPLMGEVDSVSARITEIVKEVAGEERGFRAGLVVTEACVNIVKYGDLGEEERIEIELSFENDDTKIVIEDTSREFNPLDVSDPNLNNFELLQKGGMGIYLIKRCSKKVDYAYKDNRNILTVII